MSVNLAIKRLRFLCNTIPEKLRLLSQDEFNQQVGTIWSKKQVLGHLIDSAANNHQRFIRTQFEELPQIAYDQNNWNDHNHYNEMDEQLLIQLWQTYNIFLAEILQKIPSDNLHRTCAVKGERFTLQFIIEDYVTHLEYHLHQLVSY